MNLHNLFALITTSEIARAGGLKAWHWIIFVLVVGALAVWVVPAILTWQRQRTRQTIHLELTNEGNMRSRYALRATEAPGNARSSLTFRFQASGKALLEQTVVTSRATPTLAQSPVSAAKPATAKKPVAVQQTLSSAAQTGGAIAGLLATLGRLLPGSVGQSLTGVGREVRQGQQTATQVKQASQYANKLQPGSKPQPAGKASATADTQSRAPTQAISTHASQTVLENWAQTPFIEPGQKLSIELHVQPANPYHTRQYAYVIQSRSLEYKGAPVLADEDDILIKALSPFERFMPFVIFAAGIIGLLIVFLSL